MTSEICIMNRLAVVLAADSATTVTYPSKKGSEERYFEGANKIIQLSNHRPVGVMIFGSAELLKVPWEVSIKAFRNHLGDRSFNTIPEYANEFFMFMEGETRIFPSQVQHQTFFEAARFVAMDLAQKALEDMHEDDPNLGQVIQDAIVKRQTELDQKPLLPCLPDDALQQALNSDRDALRADLENTLNEVGVPLPPDVGSLAEVAISEVFKVPGKHLGTAGLVFAGFGDHNVFPSMIEYRSCGFLGGKHVHTTGKSIDIDHNTPAWLSAFAQTAMSDTFSAGVSQDIFVSLMVSVREGLSRFVDELGAAANTKLAGLAGLEDLIEKTRKEIGQAVMAKARQEHAYPMRRVLGALPVAEMAELAETLILLQSLKEKVTKPSKSVGGPVDVAVITRNEGLVWIKRKHYFDPALNARYLQRMKITHDE